MTFNTSARVSDTVFSPPQVRTHTYTWLAHINEAFVVVVVLKNGRGDEEMAQLLKARLTAIKINTGGGGNEDTVNAWPKTLPRGRGNVGYCAECTKASHGAQDTVILLEFRLLARHSV